MPAQNSNASNPETTLVGIGASAGGLNALKSLFSHISSDSGLAYAVVVHLSPQQPSLLADLLQPFASMPVLQVAEDTQIEPNNVYVIPPGSNLSTIDSHLRLSDIETHRTERAPVDHFFETLARTHGERCIGVILSGTGSDGCLGIKKIKEQGGLTIAQDPNESEFDGMPRSAIATRLIDLVLPVQDMPRFMLRFAHTRPRIRIPAAGGKVSDEDRQTLQHLFAQVRARTGQDFSRYKTSTVLRRIRRRMQLHQRETLGGYLELLRDNPNEAHLLAEEFLITVTQFFRDAETFEYLEKEVLPGLLEGKTGSGRLRVWSVGCATGEEAYSIAMLLLEQGGKVADPPQIEVFASDLHEDSLKTAREGIYPDAIEADVSEQRLRRFFTQEDSTYQIRKEVRELVVFAAHNLLRDPPFSRLDLIVCRNLLIYLQREAQIDVVDLFHYALNPDGLLLLGPSETIDRTALFQPESKHHNLYRRRNVPPPEPRLPVFPLLPRNRHCHIEGYPQPETRVSYGALHHKMVERYALPSILVDQDFQIVHVSEHAGRYLQVPGGEPSASVFKLAREELRVDLRAAVHAAGERGEAVRSDPIDLELDGKPRRVVLHVRPSRDQELSGLLLVIFDEMALEGADVGAKLGGDGGETEEGAELEHAKDRLRSVIEQYETSQEEMRASNEELQSTNEELRSTMEELETSKEELQSMNEELQTVNQENRHKVEELSQLTSDLNNLMAATEIATLFLDRDLRILRVTPRARELFNIRSSDRGRPLTDLRHRLGYDGFEGDARAVLEDLKPIEREIRSEGGAWYLTRVLPYRSTEDQIQGVVITLVEISQLKEAELALRNSEEIFRALVSASAQIVWTTDASGRVVEDSPSWRAFTGQSLVEWLGNGWTDAVYPDDRGSASERWSSCIANETPLDIEFRLKHVSGQWRWTHVRAVPLRDDVGLVRGWVGMNTDITERKRAEERLRREGRRKDEFLATLGHELRNPLAPLQTGMDLLRRLLPDDARIREIQQMVERQVAHLTRLVDDLLDVARIKSGRIELAMERFDVRNVVRGAIEDMRAAVEARRHRLSTELPAEPLEIEGDEVRLAQVITNLLSNAVKYTPDGGRIRVAARPEDGHVSISVADSGIGIAPGMLETIFDVFAQGSHVSGRSFGSGLGLGLTLVRRLTELHGGTVEARSEGEGRGSELIVRLPLAAQPAAETAESERAEATESNGASGSTGESGTPPQKRILVVDDNKDAADSLAMALALMGHEVHKAYDGAGALETAHDFMPQVAILDIGLPDIDGHELARRLREQQVTASALLIALTGYGQDEDLTRSAEAGFDHHLVKPVDIGTIGDLLRKKG